MKIAYIASDVGRLSETFVNDLITGFSETGHQVTVLCNKSAGNALENVQVKVVRFMCPFSALGRIGLKLDAFFDAGGQQRSYKRLLNHAHRCLSPALAAVAPNAVYIDYGTVAARALSALKALKIPFVVHFHGADITSALRNTEYRQCLQEVFRSAAALIVASHHVRRLLVLEGAEPGKIRVIRLGLELEGTTPLPWHDRAQQPPTVAFLGRFTQKKHPVALVEAFALVKHQLPAVQLAMIGDGPEMPKVRERVERLGLNDAVKLYGALPRKEALAIVNQSWVYAQHSVTALSGDQEGFGISLAEAAALQLPVVSTYHNGIPEQVIHNETGFLVKEFDYETMADYLLKLLQQPALIQAMGQQGRKRATETCQYEHRLQKISALLEAAAMPESTEKSLQLAIQ